MSWKLYLDDVRTPPDGEIFPLYADIVIARTSDEAEKLVAERGMPEFISFDHDLGEIKTGHYFANWLVEQDLNGTYTFPEGFEYNVHSANPVGAANIRGVMDRYLKFKTEQNG